MQKEFRDVVGYEDAFRVSEDGDIFSKRTNRLLKIRINEAGYKTLSTRVNGKALCFKIHQLVAKAFLTPPTEELLQRASLNKAGVMVRHINNNKLDCHYSNLAYGTAQDNTDDFMSTGLYKPICGSSHVLSKLSDADVLWIRQNYKGYDKVYGEKPLAEKFGVHYTQIRRIVRKASYKNV